ncbi:organic cation/carnitine transporter 2-like isoform X4 [Haemaphysalis longicornis]
MPSNEMRQISGVIGPPRLYHVVVWALTFVRAFPSSWTQFAALFIATDVEHWCSKPHLPSLTNWTEEQWKKHAIPTVNRSSLFPAPVFDPCQMFPLVDSYENGSDVAFDRSRTVPCEAWSYNETLPGSSAVPEWDLVCEHEWQRSMMMSVVFVGSLVGSLLMGHLSDSVIQESPRWLITTHKEEKAERAIRRILTMNRRLVPELTSVVHGLVVEVQESLNVAVGPLEIFKHRRIRRNALFLFVVWFCDNFLMFAVILGAVDIKGSHYVNFAVSAAAEIPAALVGLVLVYYCSRRLSQVATLLIAGAAAVAAQFSYGGIPYMSLSMSMAGRFVLVMSASVKWVWTMELFPTAARGFGFAACFTVGRVGGIVAPFISHLNKHTPLIVSSALLALAGVVGAAAAAVLPETRGVELPDTFHEAESIAVKRKRTHRSDGTTMKTSQERSKFVNA